MKRILAIALVMVLASVAQAAAVDQIRLTPGEITGKEVVGAGAGTSGVVGIHTTVLLGDPTKPGLYTIRLSDLPGFFGPWILRKWLLQDSVVTADV
jgi:opacity protein-like surface antigen